MGGLSRRNTIVEQVRAAGPIVVVDAGGSLAPVEPIDKADLAQRRIKADLIAEAWTLGGIDAIAIGAADWRLGRDTIDALAHQYRLPVLAANLECDEPYPGALLVERGGLRIGIVGVTDGDPKGCDVSRAGPAAITALEALGPVDLTIALVPFSGDALAAFRSDGPPVDLFVSPDADPIPRPAGRGWTVPIATRGQKITRIDLFPHGARDWEPVDRVATLRSEWERLQKTADEAKAKAGTGETERHEARIKLQIDYWQEQADKAKKELDAFETVDRPPANTFSVREIELDPPIADHTATRERVDAALTRIRELEGVDVAATWPHVGPDGSRYAGSDKCLACHPVEHAPWAATPHARAWASLVAAARARDRACTECHVTGYGERGGPSGPADVAGLQDVQCEACHGAAAAHASSPKSQRPRRDPGVEVCTVCHDNQRDMGRFDFGAYRLEVVHTPPAPAVPPEGLPQVAP